MRSKEYAYFLGLVAIFAGVAVAAFGPSELIDLFGGAAVVIGLGATAWATGTRSFFRMYIAVVFITALIGGSLLLVKLMSR